VDFVALGDFIAKTLEERRIERRSEVRVRLRVSLKLRGRDSHGEFFEVTTATENVSKSGFLCGCNVALEKGATVEVALPGQQEVVVGTASIVRSEWSETLYPRYGFRFLQKTGTWVLE
jgi:hypothetical protein